MFFDFYVTLWVIFSPNKHILVKIRLEKVDLGEVYIQKEQENFKKRSSSNTIGGPLHIRFPVRLVWNFGHSSGSTVLITDQPYMFIFPQLTQIVHWADKNEAQIY